MTQAIHHTIQELGAALDAAEQSFGPSHSVWGAESRDLYNARSRYFSALRLPVLAAREQLLARQHKLRPNVGTVHSLHNEMVSARLQCALVLDAGDALGFGAREQCDVQIAEELAELTYEIFEAAFQRSTAERRAIRVGKRRDVVNGYVRTGRSVLVDGVRIPVVHKWSPRDE